MLWLFLSFWVFCFLGLFCFSFCFLREKERTCVTWEGSGRTWGRGKNIIKKYCMKKLKNIIKQKQGAGSSVTGSTCTERAQVGTAAVCPASASSRPLGSLNPTIPSLALIAACFYLEGFLRVHCSFCTFPPRTSAACLRVLPSPFCSTFVNPDLMM